MPNTEYVTLSPNAPMTVDLESAYRLLSRLTTYPYERIPQVKNLALARFNRSQVCTALLIGYRVAGRTTRLLIIDRAISKRFAPPSVKCFGGDVYTVADLERHGYVVKIKS